MARSTTGISDELLEQWLLRHFYLIFFNFFPPSRASALFFRLELPDAIVYKCSTVFFCCFLFYFFIYPLVHVPTFREVKAQ